MKVLKGYVLNRARPEGCIVERYIAEECTIFCSKYIKQTSVIGSRQARNDGFEKQSYCEGRPIRKGKQVYPSHDVLQVAHRYVLLNSEVVQPYIQ